MKQHIYKWHRAVSLIIALPVMLFHEVLKARRNHRWTSIVVALFTLMFTFSGGFHAWSKLAPADAGRNRVQPVFLVKDIHLDLNRLQEAIGTAKRITNISLVRWNNTRYWQVFNTPATGTGGLPSTGHLLPVASHQPPPANDLMKRQSMAWPRPLPYMSMPIITAYWSRVKRNMRNTWPRYSANMLPRKL